LALSTGALGFCQANIISCAVKIIGGSNGYAAGCVVQCGWFGGKTVKKE